MGKLLEEKTLAPYAIKSKDSRGRLYPETEHPMRGHYQRDRDRIIHSTAFRRLEYKTQVFVNHEGDYYRTRLTHTLEVTQIARSVAKVLKLNEDLVEAISLAHDLGHTPFGHSGEEILDEIMKRYGGFNHNLQGLRVVDYLERRYPDFDGLNLTYEVREGIVKHSTSYDNIISYIREKKGSNRTKAGSASYLKIKGLDLKISPTIETQVVDMADEIAYDNHDLDDGITSGLLDEAQLTKIPLWKEIDKAITKKYSNLESGIKKYQIIRLLIDYQIKDLIKTTEQNLKENNIKSHQDVRNFKKRLAGFSYKIQKERDILRKFLYENLYRHYRVLRMHDKAKRFIYELFQVYFKKPEQLPDASRMRLKSEHKARVICDYIAGMTDRYALDEYKKLFEPYEKV